MRADRPIQYTIRSIPKSVDEALRRRAEEEQRSLNDVVIDAMRRGLSLPEDRVHPDLDEFIGTWVEDPAFDEIVREQDQIDEGMWR